MGNLAEELTEQLNCETAFTIPLFGGIDISESVVVTWIIMGIIIALVLVLTHNLKVIPTSKRQLFVETCVCGIQKFFEGILGEKGIRYIPYLGTVALYIGFSNVIGLFGMKPPTKDMNVTAALALMSIVLIEYSGIHHKGGKRFIKSFAEPIPIMTPFNLLEIIIRPVSLCMRLFGNVLGAFVVMELIKFILPVVLPLPFSAYFDIFDGLIQTYVFVFLTALFMNETME